MCPFVAQIPARLTDDILFEQKDFRTSLESVASHIARPCASGAPSPPMVFALYGRWGAGKSTALRVLEQMVEEKVEAANASDRFSRTWYEAPLWERVEDVRASLAYEIVNGLTEGDPTLLSEYLYIIAGMESNSPLIMPNDVPLRSSLQGAMVFQRILQSYSNAPPLLEQWMRQCADRMVADRLSETGPGPGREGSHSQRVHVVLVDDLDRCRKGFTADLLAAITQWLSPNQQNLFFVMAASREHLVESVREHLLLGPRYPEQALEKYVHLGVEVPTLLSSPGDVAEYLIGLTKKIPSVSGDGDLGERFKELEQFLAESGRRYPNCLLAPLLKVDVNLTPRSAKHRFNTFLAQFKPQPGVPLSPADVKQWVMRAFWPNFWWRYSWSLNLQAQTTGPEQREQLRQVNQLTEQVDQLIDLGRAISGLWELGDTELWPALKTLADQRGADLTDVDPQLLLYINAAPAWQPPPPPPLQDDGESDGGGGRGGEGGAGWHGLQGMHTSVDATRLGSNVNEPAGSLENQAFLLYLKANQAEDDGRLEQARAALEEIRQLTQQTDFPSHAAATVGNSALIAARVAGQELALQLHRAAMRLAPGHYNIMQNYADFVLKRKISDEYSVVDETLRRLLNEGAHHRPERTQALVFRFARVRNHPIPEDQIDAEVRRILTGIDSNPSLGNLYEAIDTLVELDQPEAVREAARRVAEAARSDHVRYAALRFFADSLASDQARQASDVYRFLLSTGLACLPDSDMDGVNHNLAVSLSQLKYMNIAAMLWEDVYRNSPHDDTVRRSFAIHLNDMNRQAAAEAVLLGQELDPLGLEPEALPDRLDPDTEAWWEQLDHTPHAPCASVAAKEDK
ncbi:KAP family NTPase [Kitasatospora sp. DSM 101779]|uniref:KAP family NTPase n=1 Tax=Kitasatospora sp. DSM 101779 TaxID=2853165 RepID=UPI0021DB1F23|nr:KAP family NTPase [Kitasatospora sp. DSM 101779]MCU7824792.1 KAP family NTPase [Kitasatospora sp. DSM 101779]